MSADESELKSPLVPLFQGGIFSVDFKTPLWKRGEGEICRVEWRLELCGELQFQDTSLELFNLTGFHLPVATNCFGGGSSPFGPSG
jgi:hypothetical protein